jgi:hypothetical protein
MTEEQAERIAKALESIAASLQKMANPLLTVDSEPTIAGSDAAEATLRRESGDVDPEPKPTPAAVRSMFSEAINNFENPINLTRLQ